VSRHARGDAQHIDGQGWSVTNHKRLPHEQSPILSQQYCLQYLNSVQIPKCPALNTVHFILKIFQANKRQQYRVLAYLDDFLICPVKAWRVASMRDCRKATQVIDKLLSSLGLTRHPTKGEWVGSTRVEHLGCVTDSDRMRFYIAPRKIAKVHGITRAILRQARQGRRWVSRDRLRSFCGVCVSLSLAMPFARFHTRSLFDDMTRRPRESRASRNANRCRLSHQSIRDLLMWRKLASTETDGRPIRPLPTNGIMFTNAADVGFGGMLDVAGNQETLDSGRTKGYGNGRTEQSAFRSRNSRRFVGCSWERWENERRRKEYLY
jgi:hypothetical protein